MHKILDYDEIARLYKEEKKTTKEISEILGNCSYSTVNRVLRRMGIPIREKGNIDGKEYHIVSPFKQEIEDVESLTSMFCSNVPINDIAKKMNVSPKAVRRKVEELGLKRTKSMMSRNFYNGERDNFIKKLYEEGKSTTDIAKEIGVTHRTVINHLKRCGVERRRLFESHYIKSGKTFPIDLEDFETVYDLYITRRLSKNDISKMYDVSPNVIDRVLKKHGITKRSVSESKIGVFSGEKHPNWKGGRTGLYARLREQFAIYQAKPVLKRDGNKCQLCGSTHKLQVHHIKPFKDIFEEILSEHGDLDIKTDEEKLFKIMINDRRLNDLNNLITYCKECHLFKVHGYKHREKYA